MKEQRLDILQKVANGELTPEQADKQLLNLFSVSNSAEYTQGYRDGWRDCCKDVKEFG